VFSKDEQGNAGLVRVAKEQSKMTLFQGWTRRQRFSVLLITAEHKKRGVTTEIATSLFWCTKGNR